MSCAGKGPGSGVKEDLQGAKYWAVLRDVGLLPPRIRRQAVLWLASDESRWTTGLGCWSRRPHAHAGAEHDKNSLDSQ